MTETTNRVYTAAPLPFQGQKRKFIKEFKEAVLSFKDATTFVDLFGGSGLLSHTAKAVRPDARVIFNDYDDFSARLANVARTNKLLADFREIVREIPHEKRIPEPQREQILQRLARECESGYVDYITISSSLLFSMKYCTTFEGFQKETFYNVVKQKDYECGGYLSGLEVVSEDYRQLFDRFKDDPKAVFFVDPPYLSTDAGTYKSYWKLGNYLDVLQVLTGKNYIYFTSDKSSILELCEWVAENLNAQNPFENATVKSHAVKMNYQAGYKDFMLYKETA